MRHLFLCLLLLLAALPVYAQNDTPFKVTALDINLIDQFQRPFLAEAETAWLGVRLAQGEQQVNKDLANFKQISSGGVEYGVADQEYQKFPLRGGIAKAQFVLFKDDAKNPIAYELVMIIKDKNSTDIVRIDPAFWSIRSDSQSGEAKAEHTAPHSQREIAAIVAFAILGCISIYILFGRSLFSRMLYNRRMEVSSALGWSNLLLVVLGLVLLGCVVMVTLFPYVLYQQTYWIYVIVMGSFAALELLIYGIGAAMTRS